MYDVKKGTQTGHFLLVCSANRGFLHLFFAYLMERIDAALGGTNRVLCYEKFIFAPLFVCSYTLYAPQVIEESFDP